MPGLAEVGDSKGERNALLSRSVRNVRISQIHRADYEAYWLRKSRSEVKRLTRLQKHCRTFVGFAAISRELREWCERERILLRIKLPGVENGQLKHAHSPMIEAQPAHASTVQAEPAPSVPPTTQ